MSSPIYVPDRFLLRGGYAADLAALNEVPLRQEMVYAPDARNMKVGDPSGTPFNSLPWLLTPWAIASGTDTITVTFVDKPVLFDGMLVRVRAAGANTGAATFNPNGLGASAVTKAGGTALVANDIAGAGHELLLVYRSSVPRWELLNPKQDGNSGGGGGVSSGTSFPGSPSTDDLFYRTDHDLLCFYDGTRWLTVQVYDKRFVGSTTTTGIQQQVFNDPDYDWWPIRWTIGNVSTTNTGSAYWTFSVDKVTAAGVSTAVASANTSLATGGQNYTVGANPTAAVFDRSTHKRLNLVTAKTGLPSTANFECVLTFRRIVT